MKFSSYCKIPFSNVISAAALLSLASLNAPAQTQPCVETNGVKFFAGPQVNGGLDVKDSRNSIVLADDFLCTNSGPITDIHIWGSWTNNLHGPITNFWIGIYSDVPASNNGTIFFPSHPGNLLWFQDFGTNFSEAPYATGSEFFYNPTNNGNLGTDNQAWYYCFFPTNPFPQQGSINNPTNYWLAIHAQIAGPITLFGWKSTTNLYNDAAVWGTLVGSFPNGIWKSMTNPITQQRLNLAMKLTTPTNQPTPCQPNFIQCVENPGIKFLLPPNIDNGSDVSCSQGVALADDFQCTNNGAITDIHLWGSWLNNFGGMENVGVITNFWIGIYDDVPAVTGPVIVPSHPGTNLLWSQNFGPGQFSQDPSGQGSESFLDPVNGVTLGNDYQAWYYCFYPTNPFVQQGSSTHLTNYWLAVYAQVCDPSLLFGWKTSIIPYNDTAVWAPALNGQPIPGAPWTTLTVNDLHNQPINFSFKLTTTNPPAPCCPDTNGIKWVQGPDLLSGIDYDASQPYTLADDFKCTNSGPITDIHLWGSWLFNNVDFGATYTLAIWSDVPVGPGINFSQPGNLLWSQVFAPPNYTICPYTNVFEPWNTPDSGPVGSSTNLYYLCFFPDPANTFTQGGSQNVPTNYWLSVTVQPSAAGGGYPFGWKSSSITYNDSAVFSTFVPFPPPAGSWNPVNPGSPGKTRVDLAFKITTATNCIVPIACPVDNKTVPCGAAWSFDPPIVGPDPCCPQPPLLVLTVVTNSTTLPCNQSYTGIWTVISYCNGSVLGVCTQNVTVLDTNPPVMFNCITQKTVECGTTWTFDQPTAKYLCSGSNVLVGILSSNINPTVLCSGVVGMVVWSATNECSGAYSTCTQTVSIVDTTPPVITCATNKTVVVGTPWTFDPPTAVDACCGTNVTIIVLNTVTNTPGPCTQFITRTWQATDCCSNSSTCSQTVTVVCPPVVCVESDYEKYVQWPNIFSGFDVLNNPYVLADDFVCTNTGPVSDIHLWGSWLNDLAPTNTIVFWLGIYDDVPAVTNFSSGLVTPSRPGTNLLWQQWFAPGQYAETIWTNNAQEQFLDPGQPSTLGGDSVVWYYCFYPTNAFQQTGTSTNSKTYWLAAYAQFGVGGPKYGWKTTTNYQHDISVHALWPGFAPTNNPGWTTNFYLNPLGGPALPLDLAFKITMCGPVRIHWLPPTNVVVSWLGGGYLQSATNVTGPYLDVPGFPTSPYTDYSITPTNKFYRLRCY